MTTSPKRDQKHRTGAQTKEPILGQSDLERLLDRIQCGTIEDVEDLEPLEVELLQEYCQEGEQLVALFDRIRGASREGG